ncbi:Hypothetical protein A7982_07375 [Minicystis rosea]|nr:Hypothetical protein A7982_07375 [Minicystis rosea]
MARTAQAGAFDVEGAGPEGVAEINARAARADDGMAAFLNPGGLGLGRGVRASIAPMIGISSLTAQGERRTLADPVGIALAFDATIPLQGVLKDRIRLGFAGYVPPTTALHLITPKSDAPTFPYYENRTQRLVLIPALAVRISDALSIGVALDVLGGVSGPASVQNGASGAPEPRIDLNAATALSVNAGVRFDPSPHVRFAFAFRQRFAAPAVVDTGATVAGIPLSIQVATRSALFDPTTIVAAGSFDVGRATFEIDASYAAWSAYEGPWVKVHATLPGVDAVSALPAYPAKDVVSLRGAGTIRFDVGAQSDLVLRAGLGFEPTMLQNRRQGTTNLVDGDKLLAGLGASFTLRGVLPVALRLSVGGNLQRVFPSAQDKVVCRTNPCPADTVSGPDATRPAEGITNPGYPTLTGGGSFWSMSAGVGVML